MQSIAMRTAVSLGVLFALYAILAPQSLFAAEVSVSATDSAFTSKNITITAGDTVVWKNNGAMQHTVTSDTGSFNSGTMTPGASYSRSFVTPGTYPYYCALHGAPGGVGMSGTVTVVAAQTPAPTSSTGGTSSATSDLQARIQALLLEVQRLQQSIGSTASTPASAAASGTQCPLISRTLKRGMSGDDVTRLQQFLARDVAVYPEGQVSGFYGVLTEAAVKRFQCKNQIVCDGSPESTGYGVVGPRTAAILALQCPAGGGAGAGSGANVGGYIRVTPIQGTAPLNVSIEAHVNTTRSCTAATYELFYGDASAPVVINVPPQGCGEMVQTLGHTYTSAGTYTVTLRSGGHQTSATVTVTGSSSGGGEDTFTVSPTSGNAPLNVSFTGKANASASCSPVAYSVQFGDGTTGNIPVSNCAVSTYAITHGYNTSGTYIARLMRGSNQVTSTTIKVNDGASSQGGGSFSVSEGYGGDTFSVLASFELKSSCTAYDIDWGDATAHSTQGAGNCTAGTITKEVSHTYAGTGTYTITLKRGTGSGQTTDTAGVAVVY